MLRRFGLATLLVVPLGLLAAVTAFAAGGNVANDQAVQIATAIMVIAPLLLPFVVKYVPWVSTLDGVTKMIAVYVLSVAVSVVAGGVSGVFTLSGLSSIPGLIAAGTFVFGETQVIYQLFKDHKTFGKALK